MINTPQTWALRDGEVDTGMEGDYARWFHEHSFLRYIDLVEPIPSIDEQSSGGEDGNDEDGHVRGRGWYQARGRSRGVVREWGRYGG